jgi:hypothetical protein
VVRRWVYNPQSAARRRSANALILLPPIFCLSSAPLCVVLSVCSRSCCDQCSFILIRPPIRQNHRIGLKVGADEDGVSGDDLRIA